MALQPLVGAPSITEVIYGWGQHDMVGASLPSTEMAKFDKLAEIVVKSYDDRRFPPYKFARFTGHADKDIRGTKYEYDVSEQRAEAAKDILDKRLMGIDKPNLLAYQILFYGSSKMKSKPMYGGANRRCEIEIFSYGFPSLEKKLITTTFKIRVLQSLSIGEIIQRDHYVFEIQDIIRKKSAIFDFVAYGLALPGIPKLPTAPSLSGPGPWQTFFTTESISLEDFDGVSCQLGTNAGTGDAAGGFGGEINLTTNDLNNHGSMRGGEEPLMYVSTIKRPIVIQAGTGFSLPSSPSVTDGKLKLVPGSLR
jgi:hypothetical protein